MRIPRKPIHGAKNVWWGRSLAWLEMTGRAGAFSLALARTEFGTRLHQGQNLSVLNKDELEKLLGGVAGQARRESQEQGALLGVHFGQVAQQLV